MHVTTRDFHGYRIYTYPDSALPIRRSQDATDLIAEAKSIEASLAIIPVALLDPGFFRLHTGLAGQILQKFVNYQLKVVILGDTSAFTSESSALRDFIRESNRGNSIWFVTTEQELEDRLIKSPARPVNAT